MPSSLIRIIVADDQPVYRNGLITLIDRNASDKLRVIGEACNGNELIAEVERKKPDIVLTDIRMPVLSGLEACRVICKKFLSTAVIALTMFTDSETIAEMFRIGAKGYVVKTSGIKEVVEAVETVHSGELYYCHEIASTLVQKIGPSKFAQYRKNTALQFSKKELELMKFICAQLTSKEIAGKMKISVRTVEEYSRHIREKIDAKNLVGIALYALKNNIVSADEI